MKCEKMTEIGGIYFFGAEPDRAKRLLQKCPFIGGEKGDEFVIPTDELKDVLRRFGLDKQIKNVGKEDMKIIVKVDGDEMARGEL